MASVEKAVDQEDYDISGSLFTHADTDHSLKFSMMPCPKREFLQPLVERGGGTVSSKIMKDSIRLLAPGQTAKSRDVYSYKYILDCIKQKKLLDISKYRVAINETVTESVDNTSENEGDRTVKILAQDRSGRSSYDTSEDMAILRKLLEQGRYLKAGGNEVWKQLEQLKVTHHSWHSMRDHYRKVILPNIDKYDLSAKQKQLLTNAAVQKKNKDSDAGTKSQSSPVSHAMRSTSASGLTENRQLVHSLRSGTGSSVSSSKTAVTEFASPTSAMSDPDELDRELLARAAAHGSDGKRAQKCADTAAELLTLKRQGRQPKNQLSSPESSSDGKLSENAPSGNAEVHSPRKRGRPRKEQLGLVEIPSDGTVTEKSRDGSPELRTPEKRARPPKEQLGSPEIPCFVEICQDRRPSCSPSATQSSPSLYKSVKTADSSNNQKSGSDVSETTVEEEMNAETTGHLSAACQPTSPSRKTTRKSVAVAEGEVRETRNLAKSHISDQSTDKACSSEMVSSDVVLSNKRISNGSVSPEKRLKLSNKHGSKSQARLEKPEVLSTVAPVPDTSKQSDGSGFAQTVNKEAVVRRSPRGSPHKGRDTGEGIARQNGHGRDSSGHLRTLRDVVLNDTASEASSLDIPSIARCQVGTQNGDELENYVQLVTQIVECLRISTHDFMQAICLFNGNVDDAVSWILTGTAISGKQAWNALDDDQRLLHADEANYELLVDKYGQEAVQSRLRFLTGISQFTTE